MSDQPQNEPAGLAPQGAQSDAERKLRTLIEVTRALSEIFTHENELIAAGRADGLARLQDKKAELAKAYGASIAQIAADRRAMQQLDGEALSILRDVTRIFEQSAERHSALINAVSTSPFPASEPGAP